jgi:orotidine-5'-phosphate decarboxylase
MTLTNGENAGLGHRNVRDRLALALDVEGLPEARALARRLAAFFAVVKIGLELFVAEGPAAVEALASDGFDVFLDLKMHDIPTTVERAARRARATSATYLTVQAAGGEAMLRAAVAGFGAPEAGGIGQAGGIGAPGATSEAGGIGARPGGILAVTVLTSEPDAPESVIADRTALAARCGCAGVVCAAADLAVGRRVAPELLAVVPGVRLSGSPADDQARLATPGAATAAGAGLLVIGRTVSAAQDPEAAARRLTAEVANA